MRVFFSVMFLVLTLFSFGQVKKDSAVKAIPDYTVQFKGKDQINALMEALDNSDSPHSIVKQLLLQIISQLNYQDSIRQAALKKH